MWRIAEKISCVQKRNSKAILKEEALSGNTDALQNPTTSTYQSAPDFLQCGPYLFFNHLSVRKLLF